jgi:tRNA-intron endonuclease
LYLTKTADGLRSFVGTLPEVPKKVISITAFLRRKVFKPSALFATAMTTMVKALLEGDAIRTENSSEARELFTKSQFGALLDDGRVQISAIEAAYLAAKKRLIIVDSRNKSITLDRFINKARRKDKAFWTRYAAFKDLRDRGYTVKTALKFGADFRVYERGIKPGQDHARWIAYPVSEHNVLSWREFASKNRVAHSTKKKLLLCIVDDEGDVSYWEVGWLKP